MPSPREDGWGALPSSLEPPGFPPSPREDAGVSLPPREDAGLLPPPRERGDVPPRPRAHRGVLPHPEGEGELPPSDGELIERVRAGDDTAYGELYRRHVEAVRRYARACCRDAHTTDDLTAEVFARMLQAVRGGSGPEHTVRPYLLVSVRRAAAHWTRTARREQLVDDFAVFAAQAARLSDRPDGNAPEPGADVRAMHEAEQSLAMRAFRSLPERWQAVLWHTEVEDESPGEVAVLFGLDANGTRALAGRAREGLRQAYLQAHVGAALTGDEECARHAGRLGAYTRGRLRARAERGLRKHLEKCARCRLAAGQIQEIAAGIPAVVPVAVLGWPGAAGYAKALGVLAGGAGAGAAGAAGTVGEGAAGTPGTVAASGGSPGASGGVRGAAASEALGAAVRAGDAAGVVAVAATAALVLALAGHDHPGPERPEAKPPASSPIVRPEPPAPAPPGKPHPAPPGRPRPGSSATPVPAAAARPTPRAAPTPVPVLSRHGRSRHGSVSRPASAPGRPPAPPRLAPAPTSLRLMPAPRATSAPHATSAPRPAAAPTPSPTPSPTPVVHRWSEVPYDVAGDGGRLELRLGDRGRDRDGDGGRVGRRHGLPVDGMWYAHGVTVRGPSAVTVDPPHRDCTARDAPAGVEAPAAGRGRVRFSVDADGARPRASRVVSGGEPAVGVHGDLSGHRTVHLVVESYAPFGAVAAADRAESHSTCR
ncbi:sigma-70 family RNA polymerase sigma factor [Streptomyces echinoruber]